MKMDDKDNTIYTRQGDQGLTTLLSGEKVYKDDLQVKSYGALDELQSQLGLARSLSRDEEISSMLITIQHDVLTASSELASRPSGFNKLKKRLARRDAERLEEWIDRFTGIYGLPGHFILPGASPDSAALHVARSVCRRCERIMVTLNRQTRSYDRLLVYFNRLGDLLFTLAWAVELSSYIESVLLDLMGDSQQEVGVL
jgi:cob(I)alamin adenosyltransferase